MIEGWTLVLYLGAALVIAITPGPGIFYVAARTLAAGRGEGLASSIGTGIGGLVHVVAGAIGVSALLMASAEAFTALKLIGAGYLIFLGYRTIREAATPITAEAEASGTARAFRDGIIVEAFNPKTAAFFLAFIPQFVDPAGSVMVQFIVLGLISVTLNTLADVVVAFVAAGARQQLVARPRLIRRLREGAGVVIAGLGLSLLMARRA